MTLVSIVIPTYNRCDLLMERSLPSALAQTHPGIEVLVVGDGTDSATCDAMAALHNQRVRFWNLPHAPYPLDPQQRWQLAGIDALNFGLEQACGTWVAALGDDDALEPDMVEVLLAASEGADVVYGVSVVENGSGLTYGSWPPGHGAFTDGANIRRNQGYRYERACVERGLPEDGDLWVRMLADGRRFRLVERVVHHYYPHGGR